MDKQYDLPRLKNLVITRDLPSLPGHTFISASYTNAKEYGVTITETSSTALLKGLCDLVNSQIDEIEKSLA